MMKQEKDGMVGTEWQPVDLGWDGNFAGGAGNLARKVLNWTKEYDGVGKFYLDNIFGLYYFECEEDRSMFLLKWS